MTTFPAYVAARTAAAIAQPTDQVPIIRGGTATLACPTNILTGWNVVLPTGGSSDDTGRLQAAFNTSATTPVWLVPGQTYNASAQLTIPAKGLVASTWLDSYNSSGNNPDPRGAVISVTSATGYSNGQGCILMAEESALVGVSLKGLGGTFQINGILTINSGFQLVFGCTISSFYQGIERVADTGQPGHPNQFAQGMRVEHTSIFNCNQSGFHTTVNGATFVSDDAMIGGRIVACLGPLMSLNSGAGMSVVGVRIEDATLGASLTNFTDSFFTGNVFDRTWPPFVFNGCSNIVVVGNYFSGYPNNQGGPSGQIYHFTGNNNRMMLGPNGMGFHFAASYTVDAGFFVGGDSQLIDNTSSGQTSGRFTNAYTQCVLSGLFNPSGMSPNLLDPQWTAQNCTVVYGAANGPLGNNTAIRITEDATNNSHQLAQTNFGGFQQVIPNGYYLLSCFIHPGSSGTRNVGISVFNIPTFADGAGATFNPSTGALVSTTATGGMSVLGTPSATAMGDGWWQIKIAILANVAAGSFQTQAFLGLVNGSTGSYLGDGASNCLVASPLLRQGLT